MEDNTRSNRRARARATSDLRRKVLLKNFLREQMSVNNVQNSENVQPVESQHSSEDVDIENMKASNDKQNNEITSSPPKSADLVEISDTVIEANTGARPNKHPPWISTLLFDFSKITELKLSRLNPLKRKSTPLSPEDIKKIASTFTIPETKLKSEELIAKPHFSGQEETDLPRKSEHKFKKLGAHLKNKLDSRQKRTKGIFKAKHVLKILQSPFKRKHASDKRLKTEMGKMLSDTDSRNSRTYQEDDVYSEDFKSSNTKCSPFTWQAEGAKMVRVKDEIPKRRNSFETIPFAGQKGVEDGENRCCSIPKSPIKYPETNSFTLRFDEKGKMKTLQNEGSTLNRKPQVKRPYECEDVISQKRLKSSSTQSMQTDISWSLHEIRKLERANRRLQEENRLLSQSLSCIMADVDAAFSPYQEHIEPQLYNNPIGSLQDRPVFPGVRKEDGHFRDSDSIRSKVARSRSVQERAERRREVKLRLSSRSMCHRQYARISPKSLYRAKPCIITPYSTPKATNTYPPSPIFGPTIDHGCGKNLSRRSSMPEGSYRRPLLSRRSSNVHETQAARSRHSLLSLPTEAFY